MRFQRYKYWTEYSAGGLQACSNSRKFAVGVGYSFQLYSGLNVDCSASRLALLIRLRENSFGERWKPVENSVWPTHTNTDKHTSWLVDNVRHASELWINIIDGMNSISIVTMKLMNVRVCIFLIRMWLIRNTHLTIIPSDAIVGIVSTSAINRIPFICCQFDCAHWIRTVVKIVWIVLRLSHINYPESKG